jgi:hypothetical protein
VAPFPEIGEVQPARAAADYGDTHALPPNLSVY